MKRRPCDTAISMSVTEREPATPGLDRRTFLVGGSAMLAAAAALAVLPFHAREEMVRETFFTGFAERQKNILRALQEHLFPRESKSPGAADINAASYLEGALGESGFDADVRNFVVNGFQWLEDATKDMYDMPFTDLDFTQKESLLRYLADNTRWGENWLSTQLRFIFEALLSDPVYGGNPDGIGWKWLEHQAGFPRPPANKVFGKL